MQSTVRVFFTVVLVLFASQAARAGDTTPVPVFSFDDTSCGAWVRSQKEPELRQVYLFWFRGFVSGYNFGSTSYQVPLAAMPDITTLTLHIDKHCRENPLSPFIGAAFSLVKEQRLKVVK